MQNASLDAIIQLVNHNVDLQVDNNLLRMKAIPLGQIIEKLKTMDQNKPVVLESNDVKFTVFNPHSYRGYYRMLAIEPMEASNYKVLKPVRDLINELEQAIGNTFTGYKGGDYTMDKDTWVFVSHYGMASGMVIIDIVEKENEVQIIIKDEEEK